MTDPGAFVLIGTEYDIVVARALTITATSACLIAAATRELVMLPLSIGTGASLDFSLDGYHVVAALEDGWDPCGLRGARFPSPLLLGPNQGACAGVAPQAARRYTAVADDFVRSNTHLLSHWALGALCEGACGARRVRGIQESARDPASCRRPAVCISSRVAM